MSHLVSIKAEVKDPAAISAACTRLQLAAPVAGTHRMYERSVEGVAVRLKGWTYPVVANVQTGDVQYDNFGGRWGADAELGRFLQAYLVEKAKIEARKAGQVYTERPLDAGYVLVEIDVPQ